MGCDLVRTSNTPGWSRWRAEGEWRDARAHVTPERARRSVPRCPTPLVTGVYSTTRTPAGTGQAHLAMGRARSFP